MPSWHSVCCIVEPILSQARVCFSTWDGPTPLNLFPHIFLSCGSADWLDGFGGDVLHYAQQALWYMDTVIGT
jgi:hypothetical protein